jgi:hypothetical protein
LVKFDVPAGFNFEFGEERHAWRGRIETDRLQAESHVKIGEQKILDAQTGEPVFIFR